MMDVELKRGQVGAILKLGIVRGSPETDDPEHPATEESHVGGKRRIAQRVATTMVTTEIRGRLV
jgi:hypothetical protein